MYHNSFPIHSAGEARSKPFIAVFEPYKGINGNSVKEVITEKRDDGSFFTALTIFNKNGSTQQVFQSVDCEKKFDTQKGSFKGYYGVIGFSGKKFKSLYLGAGTEISNSGYSLKSMTRNGSGCLTTEGKNFTVSCNQETEIRLPVNSVKRCWLQQGSSLSELKFTSSVSGVCLTVSSIDNGLLILE
jgi:hypothetical protein